MQRGRAGQPSGAASRLLVCAALPAEFALLTGIAPADVCARASMCPPSFALAAISLAAVSSAEFLQSQGLTLFHGAHPQRFLGANCYWLMAEASYGESGREKVQQVLDKAVTLGVSVVRTWAFADGPGAPSLQPRQGQFNPKVLTALDFVVAEAAKRDIRLLLPLLNYWEDYGGVAAYEKWRALEQGIPLSDVPAWHPTSDCPLFYSAPISHKHFEDTMHAIVRHVNTHTGVPYRDDPTIMGWELCNECRCRGAGRAPELEAWVHRMASTLKAIAPQQLVGVGVEGFFRPRPGLASTEVDALNPSAWFQHEGVDFLALHNSSAIDFASYRAQRRSLRLSA